jgi:hypothetical protein
MRPAETTARREAVHSTSISRQAGDPSAVKPARQPQIARAAKPHRASLPTGVVGRAGSARACASRRGGVIQVGASAVGRRPAAPASEAPPARELVAARPRGARSACPRCRRHWRANRARQHGNAAGAFWSSVAAARAKAGSARRGRPGVDPLHETRLCSADVRALPPGSPAPERTLGDRWPRAVAAAQGELSRWRSRSNSVSCC